MAVDPAISEKTKADFSAIVSGLVVCDRNNISKLYILPNIVNVRLSTPDLVDRIKALVKENQKLYDVVQVVVESVAFQEAIVQFLQRDGYANCEGIKVSEDKRVRLATISHRVKCEDILFPRIGAEPLITQIVGFGAEKHDDLMDAFTLCSHKFANFQPAFIGFA